MSDTTSIKPARRFLHICYCCRDVDAVTQFFVDGLALRNTMRTPEEPGSGAILGMPGEITSQASFVYDARGPRTSPAIEIQSWIDPPLVGEPVQDPSAVGMQALGFAVPDLAAASEQLVKLGCTVLGSGSSALAPAWSTLRDPTGVTVDLVADADVPAGETRLRHLRITATDLDQTVPWYEGLGFEELQRVSLDDGAFLGVEGEVRADVVRLRLPDEPFEVLATQWHEPAGHGRHPDQPNHAGLFRTAVGVDDTRAAHAAMVEAGWTFDRAPMLVELTGTPVPDMWICFLSDPDGVPFEFVGRPRSSFKS